MAKLSSINKNNKRIKLANKFYKKRQNLKKIISNITLYNCAASDKDSQTQLGIPKRFKTINSKNYEEKYKLGSATIHKNNNLNDEDYED